MIKNTGITQWAEENAGENERGETPAPIRHRDNINSQGTANTKEGVGKKKGC